MYYKFRSITDLNFHVCEHIRSLTGAQQLVQRGKGLSRCRKPLIYRKLEAEMGGPSVGPSVPLLRQS